MEDLTKHYLISGRVQGVGYRAFVSQIAAQMHLRGWVRNLSDGRVEALACGAPALLLSFETRLRLGSPASEVESVLVSEAAQVTGLKDDFEIKKDSEPHV